MKEFKATELFRADVPSSFALKQTLNKTSGPESCALLVKIARQGANVTVHVVGKVVETVRSRELADFRFGDSSALVPFANIQFPPQCTSAPAPPVFCANAFGTRYKFKQNPFITTQLVDTEQGRMVRSDNIIRRQPRHRERHVSDMDNNQKPLLDEPTGELLALVIKLESIFETRCIWSRKRLVETQDFSPSQLVLLPKALVHVAWFCPNRPFGRCWIKYDVDPRKDKSLRVYQTCDLFRTYACQLIDVTDPELRKTIHSIAGTNQEYDEKYGWYKEETITTIRDAIKSSRAADNASGQADIGDSGESIHDDSHSDDDGSEENVDQEVDAFHMLDPDGEMRVHARVNELYSSWQNAVGSTDAALGTEIDNFDFDGMDF